jgi:hypothetical protein
LGAVPAATGIGASVSNLVASSIVVAAGYNAGFALGALTAAGFILYLLAIPAAAPMRPGDEVRAQQK